MKEIMLVPAEVLGVVVVGVDEEAAQVSVRHAAVLTDRSLEAAEIGKPVDGPVLGVDPDVLTEERPDLVLVCVGHAAVLTGHHLDTKLGELIGVNLHPVHVDPIEREQLLDALLGVGKDGVVGLLHLNVALHLLRLVEQGHVILGDTECGLGF